MFFIAKINKKITFSPESSKKRCIQYIYKIISSKIFFFWPTGSFWLEHTYYFQAPVLSKKYHKLSDKKIVFNSFLWKPTKQLFLPLRHRYTLHFVHQYVLLSLQPETRQHLGTFAACSGQWCTPSSRTASVGLGPATGSMLAALGATSLRTAAAAVRGSAKFSLYMRDVATSSLNSNRG